MLLFPVKCIGAYVTSLLQSIYCQYVAHRINEKDMRNSGLKPVNFRQSF